ncbi:hypothetical protein Tco_1427399 [Tanacetum coccineum]
MPPTSSLPSFMVCGVGGRLVTLVSLASDMRWERILRDVHRSPDAIYKSSGYKTLFAYLKFNSHMSYLTRVRATGSLTIEDVRASEKQAVNGQKQHKTLHLL